MADHSLPANAASDPEQLAYLSLSERRAYEQLAGTSQPLMQVVPRTMLRLLAQVEAQARQPQLHERREKGLMEQVDQWQKMGPDFPDYYDAGMEVKAILEDAHYGDPAYQEPDMEHDGVGWAVPPAYRNDSRGL